MERAAVDGVELDYELQGSGDAVVLIHWGVSATWAEPLLEQPALADNYRLLNYHRAGFGGSSRVDAPISFADHAEHCRLLMSALGIEHAHIVGHSSSAAIALQLALDSPDAVRTLALLEPARPTPATEVQAAFRRDVAERAVERFQAGDRAGAVDTWATGVFGPGYREVMEQGLPGAIEQCLADADAFFRQELPAVQQWSFTQDDAGRIEHPVLIVVGEDSPRTFPERRDLLLSWLPNARSLDLASTTHLLHLQNPRGVAEGIAGFYADC
jgi:pimeloyl-ACP methyl ester carboxylesterase